MKTFKPILTLFALTLLLGDCTKLDENVYSRLSADNFYKTKEEVNTGLVNVYYRLSASHIWLPQWQLQECSTDHGMCRWGDGNVYKQDQLHTWTSQHGPNGDVYRGLYGCIASANSFIETLNRSDISIKAIIEAEVKAIRAFCYLELCDLYGNVPLVTVATLDALNLPATSPRKEVFDFVERELKESITLLPALRDMANKKSYYPRIAKETAQTMLAKLYLNAEVYSGTARWQDCVNYCNEVINSGVYALEPNIWNAFTPTNDQSNELILAISKDNAKNDPAFTNWTNVLSTWGDLEGAYIDGKLAIRYGGWGGPSVLEEHYNIYEDPDFRKSLILKGKFYDGNGKLLIDLVPFSNDDIYQFTDKSTGRSQRHDLVIYRYADVLLSKAEALTRLTSSNKLTAEAADLVNSVRKRNFTDYTAKGFTTNNTLDDLLMERSREFLWECSYRTDLVRFGKFITEKTKWKTYDDPAYRNIFPIPLGEIQSNTNLKQNDGY
jgi:starch-binding outer membrane protein, SusD/RagB family